MPVWAILLALTCFSGNSRAIWSARLFEAGDFMSAESAEKSARQITSRS
jgi:hypothetical protein